jgi:phosphatidylglycerol:prolipoprotein diacylglycerol transferase
VPIGLGFGRIANFINGELWGRPTTVPSAIGVIFPAAGPEPRHPASCTRPCSRAWCCSLVLCFVAQPRLAAKARRGDRDLFLAGYGLIRIRLENVRQPDAGMPAFPLGLTMGMILSIPMLLAGVWLIWRARARPRREEARRPTGP